MVPESVRFFVNARWQYFPDGNQQEEPENGKYKKRERLDPVHVDQYGRDNGKNIDDDQQDFDLRPGYEMISECLKYLFFVIPEMDRHPASI
jgi:hypothetical protein